VTDASGPDVAGAVALAVTVHVANAGLLHLPGWVAESPGTGLVVTEAALKDLAPGLLSEPGASRVTVRR
jgi:hypothetical protein